MSEILPGETKAIRSKKSQFIIQLSGGAIFGALSIVVAIVLSPIINTSRIPVWQIALFDPTSWIWVICFLIFGLYAGLLSCLTGSFGLLLIDPSGWIGPIFKFCATVPLIVIPYFIFKLKESQKLKSPRNYTLSGVISTAVRMVAMIGLNFLFFATVWGIENLPYVTLEVFGLGNITGVTAVLIFTPIINLYTSALDLIVPYFLVFVSKLDEKFGFW